MAIIKLIKQPAKEIIEKGLDNNKNITFTDKIAGATGGKMRKKGAKGAPKPSDFKRAKKTARKK